MAQTPKSTVSKQTTLKSASAKQFSLINLHVKTAMQAVPAKDSQSLHFAFLNIGRALGVDKAITDVVNSYTKHLKAPQECRRDLKNTRMIFYKDWNHLEAMVADISLEEKIKHVQEFMRSRQIPPYVVITLHVPNRTIKDEDSPDEEVRFGSASPTAKKLTNHKISCDLREILKSTKPSSNWDNKRHKDSENRERAREYESKTRSDKLSPSDSKRSSSTDDVQSKGSRQVAKSSEIKKDSDRAKKGSENKKLSHDKVEKIVHKDSPSRKRPRDDQKESRSNKRLAVDSKRLDSTNAVQSKVSSRVEKRSTEFVKSKDKILHKDLSNNYQHARDDKSDTRSTNIVDCKKSYRDLDVTSSDKVVDFSTSNSGVTETKRSSSPPTSDFHVTKLVIQNLHPLVDDTDISMIFRDFKSYKSCQVKFYDYGTQNSADVVFEEEADALQAKNQFDGKKLDGLPIHIAVVKSGKN